MSNEKVILLLQFNNYFWYPLKRSTRLVKRALAPQSFFSESFVLVSRDSWEMVRHSATEFRWNHMCIWVRGHCVPTVSLTVLGCVENILFSENPAWKKDNYSVSVHVCYLLLRPCYHCERCTAIAYVGFVVRALIKLYLANEFLGHRTWSLNRNLSIF